MKNSFIATTNNPVNIRSGPGISYSVTGSAAEGETFDIISIKRDEEDVNWYEISSGFICSKYCTFKLKEDTKLNKLKFVSEIDNSEVSNPLTDIVTNTANGVGNFLSSSLEKSLDNVFGSKESYEAIFKRRIFGTPYQFLGTADIRTNPEERNKGVGRIYATNILRESPILSIMPCKPNYLPGLSTEEKTQVTKSLLELIADANTDLMKTLSQETIDNIETRYFTTDIDHVDYMKYVNLLCRAAALYMGIGEKMVPGTTIPYKQYDWTRWRMQNIFSTSISVQDNGDVNNRTITGSLESIYQSGRKQLEEMSNAISDAWKNSTDFGDFAHQALNDPNFMDKVSTEQYYVDFYVTPSTSYSETFSNNTENSAFSNILNKGGDFLKEISFALGANAIDSESLKLSLANVSNEMRNTLERIGGGEGIFSRLLMDAQTIISGSNIIFPEIWHNSERSQSYRAEIKLVSPYGTKEAIYLNTLVPMFHILAFTLPKQTSVNSYGAPFLIKAHINKWFSCEMGIIDSCEIQKGGWNVDGFPSEITISISFKDLYSMLPMSKFDNLTNGLRFAMNQSLLEYLSVLCGLNLKVSEFETKFRMLKTLAQNMPSDFVHDTAAEIKQSGINAVARILGSFGGKV